MCTLFGKSLPQIPRKVEVSKFPVNLGQCLLCASACTVSLPLLPMPWFRRGLEGFLATQGHCLCLGWGITLFQKCKKCYLFSPHRLYASGVASCVRCSLFLVNMGAYQVPAQVSIPSCLWHCPPPLAGPSLLWGGQALAPASCCFSLLPSGFPLTSLHLGRAQPLRSHWGSILLPPPRPRSTLARPAHFLLFSTIPEIGSFNSHQRTS